MSSGEIQPINRNTVHRICSGQVVLSLAIAVKELVENSIDAGATIIDIKLKEYGSEHIEVSDNGNGVQKDNFQALTLKHYTSKIKEFSDLETIGTLGFRGEALSSLCALSDLVIVTRYKSDEVGTKISYDHNGKITSEIAIAREIGTTVILKKLFSTLPVRRKEFSKNLKREFNRMCQLLYAYCLVSKGIKFSCTNSTKKGQKNTIVTTEGSLTVRENIIKVFDAKQISSLIEIELVRPQIGILEEYGIKLEETEDLPFCFEFLISSVTHKCGRNINDRQFYFINSRPCEPTKIMKLINEIYKQYNQHQYPFVYLNIFTKSCFVDVNVTPDKRQIFLEKEKYLLATIKVSLHEAFKAFPSTFMIQNTQIKDDENLKGLKRNLTDSAIKRESLSKKFKRKSKTDNDKTDGTLEKFVIKNHSQDIEDEDNSSGEESTFNFQNQQFRNELRNFTENTVKTENLTKKFEKKSNTDKDKHKTLQNFVVKNRYKEDNSLDEELILPIFKLQNPIENEETSEELQRNSRGTKINNSVENHSEKEKEVSLDKSIQSEKNLDSFLDIACKLIKKEKAKDVLVIEGKNSSDLKTKAEENVIIEKTTIDISKRKFVTIITSMNNIKELLENKEVCKKNKSKKVKFRSEINPESNKSAEEELQRQISKDDFKKMTIIGQFNLGFIITRLENDLFIIDQHATNEKYNFEQLQLNTTLENQVLVHPKPLELTAGNESLLIENEDIFRKNGFTFRIDHSAPCTKKVQLTAIPMSKNWVFGKDDIDEMLFLLQDSNQIMCRPSRIRTMFASRACRSSVMIGKSLSKNEMRKLVDHMSEIEQPWNCPHGRPTMRHLINLDLIQENLNTNSPENVETTFGSTDY